MEEYNQYMKQALLEADKAFRLKEVPIGAVIEYQGQIIGRGYNRRNTDKSTLAHAEIMAIQQASAYIGDWRLEDTTMYVTLEPCPMCAGAIVSARMKKVVIGCDNYKAGSCGTIVNLLEQEKFNHQVVIERGIMEFECKEILQQFFRNLRAVKNLPASDSE